MLGRPANTGKLAGDKALGNRVRRLYLEEYVKVWDAFLADIRLVKINGLDRSIAAARLLSAVDSPLAAFLRAASRETVPAGCNRLLLPSANPANPATV